MMKIFTLLILLLLLPVTALAQETNVSYIYYTWDDVSQILTQHDGTAETATVVTDQTTWSNGWYVVNSDTTINSRVTVTGNVHLILADGCKLTVTGGIQVQDDDNNPDTPSPNSLTIYAQSTDENTMGKLTAKGADYNAGIGGGNGSDGGTVTIHGGTVNATSDRGAGIGGGGGGVISGGSGGKVTIHGGTVNATSNSGAGIGGGGGDISGDSGSFSTGTNGNAFIIASSDTGDAISDQSGKGSWSGVIFEGDEGGLVYGSPITLTTDATIPAGKTLTIENGKTLTIGEGVTLTVKEGATLTVEGTLTNNGTVENNGRIVNKGGTINGVTNYLNPVDLDENMVSLEATPFTYTGDAIEPEVTVSNGNVTYISHEVVEKMGILCRDYRHGGGDHDYTYLVHKAGYPLIVLKNYVGTCENDHKEGGYADFLSMRLKDRIRYLYSPVGFNLHNTLLFQKRCFPYRYPFVWIMGYAKAIFPQIYFLLYKKWR